MNEKIITIGTNAAVMETEEEKSLDREASQIELRVNALTVDSDLSSGAAGELLKQVKQMQKTIKAYWEPMRLSAKQTYDDVLAKKKEMLDPIDTAEKVLKKKMGAYTLEQERKARELEAARRREAEAAAAKKLEEAVALESQGKAEDAEYAMAEAEVYDGYADTISIAPKTQKVTGVSTTKTWRIKSIDMSKVPVMFNGVVIRPVDEKAVLRLVKASKGQITIPGVEIEEDVSMSVRV